MSAQPKPSPEAIAVARLEGSLEQMKERLRSVECRLNTPGQKVETSLPRPRSQVSIEVAEMRRETLAFGNRITVLVVIGIALQVVLHFMDR